jgi:hypothetical protein
VKSEEIKGYWICSACAARLGGKWPKDHVATFAKKECETCNGEHQVEDFISPYVDYNWEDPAFTGHCQANRD